jgi:hypothetical protein
MLTSSDAPAIGADDNLSVASFADRRSAAAERITALRREAGIAALDGTPFDHAALAAAEAEYQALGAAEGEQTRRDRAAAGEAENARSAAMRTKLAKMGRHYLAAIDRAEAATLEQAHGLRDAMSAAEQIVALCRALGMPIPSALMAHTLERRLMVRMAVSLRPLTGRSRQFGGIQYPDRPDMSPHWEGAWRDGEAKFIEGIQP